MKHWHLAVALICLGSRVAAQPIDPQPPAGDLTLGGIPKLIGQKLQEIKPAGFVDLKGHLGGGGYLPVWSFHDKDGVVYVEAADVGYRAQQGQKPSILVMPFAVNVVGLSGRFWNFQWARDHLTRSKFPAIFLGAGPLLPLDKDQIKALRINDPTEWLGFVGSVRW